MESSKIIDGKNISNQIRDEIKSETEILKKEKGITPGLAFIIAGDDPASKVYVRNKGKACEEAGFHSVTEVLPESITEIQLLELIWKYNADENIHGILTQLPLPLHIDPQRVIEAIDPKKDVDGFHPVNVGKLSIGEKCFIPCTPFGIMELLRREKIETSGKHAVIIGRSNIVGKPVASLLLGKDMNSTVTVCHSKTADIKGITSQADILIAAIGRADFVKKDFIKDGVVIIDVGINRVEDKSKKSGYRITGDVDFEDCLEKCSKITPVPGGVGPMTIAMLLRNTLDSAKGDIYG